MMSADDMRLKVIKVFNSGNALYADGPRRSGDSRYHMRPLGGRFGFLGVYVPLFFPIY